MNIARDKTTGEEIEAEELKSLNYVDSENYECIDNHCKIQLFPCSYKKHNKTRPYFKTSKTAEHTQLCSFSQYTILLKKARGGDISKNGLIPYPYPSRLVVASKSTFKADSDLLDNSLNSDRHQHRSVQRSSEATNHITGNRTVTAVGQIIDFYLNCPFNRDVSLDLLGTQTKYQYAFKRIYGKNEGQYKGRKIYYGIMHLYVKPIETQNAIQIQLLECEEWIVSADEIKSQKNPYKVLIQLENLSPHKKARILNERTFVQEDQIRAENTNNKFAFIFFLGDSPDLENPYTFKVCEDYVVCRYDEILKTVKRN